LHVQAATVDAQQPVHLVLFSISHRLQSQGLYLTLMMLSIGGRHA